MQILDFLNVQAGPVWRLNVAILSPKTFRDNTSQLRAYYANIMRRTILFFHCGVIHNFCGKNENENCAHLILRQNLVP